MAEPLTVDSIAVSLLPAASTEPPDQFEHGGLLERQTSRSSEQSLTSTGSAASAHILELYSRAREVVRQKLQPIDLVEYVELEPDRRTVSACGVMCQSVEPQQSPNTPMPVGERVVTRRGDWDLAFAASDCVLRPGENELQLSTRASFL